MRSIQKYVEEIRGELDGAKVYAENYVASKVKGDTAWASKYRDMANDELKHAGNLHELAVKEIQDINKVVQPPQEMLDRWDAAHREYVDNAALVRQMLSM